MRFKKAVIQDVRKEKNKSNVRRDEKGGQVMVKGKGGLGRTQREGWRD